MGDQVMSAFTRLDRGADFVDHHAVNISQFHKTGWHHFSYEVENWSEVFSGAAHLAKDGKPARFGKLIHDYLRSTFDKPARSGKRIWTGNILKIDRFGNLISNFHISEFAAVTERPFELLVGPRSITRFARTFADAPFGELVVIEGSAGYLEVAANQASAAKMIGCAVGTQADLTIW